MKRRKKNYRFVIILIIIALLCPLTRKLHTGTAEFTVPKGASSVKIAEILKENGLINSKLYFLARLKLSPYQSKLRYGSYELEKNTFVGDILKHLASEGEKKETVTVTIPEGYSIEKICDTLCGAGLTDEDEFYSAAEDDYDYEFLKNIPSNPDINYRLQGFLYPSTYEFFVSSNAHDIIDKLLSEFKKQTAELNISDKDIFEVVTKASLVEREAKFDSERATIAGVFENRLKANMRLQVDATVVYAVTDGKYDIDKVTYKNLDTNSKYNTYKYAGLPVGPICSPSIKSIKAALNPEKHEFLYYHTDTDKNDGSHIFTKTFDEHKNTK